MKSKIMFKSEIVLTGYESVDVVVGRVQEQQGAVAELPSAACPVVVKLSLLPSQWSQQNRTVVHKN